MGQFALVAIEIQWIALPPVVRYSHEVPKDSRPIDSLER